MGPLPGQHPSTTTAPTIDDATARWFVRLWALGFLFHFELTHRYQHDGNLLASLALIGLSLLVLFRPTMGRTFLALCGLQVVIAALDTYREVVFVSWFLQGAVSATLLYAYVRNRSRNLGNQSQSLTSALTSAAPSIRALLLVVYFFAVFHKLNSGYFAPEYAFPLERIQHLPVVRNVELFRQYAAELGLFTELLIGALLALPRTRIAGVAIGASFHGALGFTGYSQFAFLYPLYMLFLSPAPGPNFSKSWARWAPPQYRPWMLAAGATFFASELIFSPSGQPLRKVVWAAYVSASGASLFAYFIATRKSTPTPPVPVRFTKGPLLFAAWCLLPYFGLVAHPCLTMYSNLRVDSGISNHFIMPASLQLDAIHDDLIIIEKLQPERGWKHQFPVGRKLPHQAVRHWMIHVRKQGPAPELLVYRHRGKRLEVKNGVLAEERLWDHVPILDYNHRLISKEANHKASSSDSH